MRLCQRSGQEIYEQLCCICCNECQRVLLFFFSWVLMLYPALFCNIHLKAYLHHTGLLELRVLCSQLQGNRGKVFEQFSDEHHYQESPVNDLICCSFSLSRCCCQFISNHLFHSGRLRILIHTRTKDLNAILIFSATVGAVVQLDIFPHDTTKVAECTFLNKELVYWWQIFNVLNYFHSLFFFTRRGP